MTRCGMRRFPRPDDPGNPTVDFHGERRWNVTHASTADPEARLARKSRGHETLSRSRLDGEPQLADGGGPGHDEPPQRHRPADNPASRSNLALAVYNLVRIRNLTWASATA